MRIPRKLKKKLRKKEWDNFVKNADSIIGEMLVREMFKRLYGYTGVVDWKPIDIDTKFLGK